MRTIYLLVVISLFFLTTPLLANTSMLIGTGQIAEPAFGKTLDGDLVSIAEHKDKVLVAMYYTSWCGYCRKAMPHLKSFQQAAKDLGLQVVLINHKEERKLFRDHVRWAKDSSLVMAHDKNGEFGAAYDVQSYPHIIVTDHHGKVVVVNKGWGDNSRQYYADLLGQLLDEKNLSAQASATPSEPEQQEYTPRKSKNATVLEVNREIEIVKPNFENLLEFPKK